MNQRPLEGIDRIERACPDSEHAQLALRYFDAGSKIT